MKVQLLALFSFLILIFFHSCDTAPTGGEKDETKTGGVSGRIVTDIFDNWSSEVMGVEEFDVSMGIHNPESEPPFDPPEYESIQKVKTDSEGRFLFEDIPVGSYSLWYTDFFFDFHCLEDIEVASNYVNIIPEIKLNSNYLVLYGTLAGIEPDTLKWYAHWNEFAYPTREWFSNSYHQTLVQTTPYQFKYAFKSSDWINDVLCVKTYCLRNNDYYTTKHIKFVFHNSNKTIYLKNINLGSIPDNSASESHIIDLY